MIYGWCDSENVFHLCAMKFLNDRTALLLFELHTFYQNYEANMNSHYTDIWSTTSFHWTDRIRAIVRNADGSTISFDQLQKEIIRQYRQAKPDSDKSTKELTYQLEKALARAPFLARLGNDIYYLYYLQNEKQDFY